MKYLQKLISFLILFYLFSLALGADPEVKIITFEKTPKIYALSGKSSYIFRAKFNGDANNYLYMYPHNNEEEDEEADRKIRAAFRIYVKKYDESDTNVNYLTADYSTIEVNSGLFIRIGDLDYKEAYIFIIGYEKCSFVFSYQIVTQVSFPEFDYNSNFQLNQFKLPNNNKGITINFPIPYAGNENDYLIILSKTSLRNILIEASYGTKKIPDSDIMYLFPNGYSLFLNRKIFTTSSYTVDIKLTNKNNKDEIIILGYMHLYQPSLFPNNVYNGFQLYMIGNSRSLQYLYKSDKNGNYEYFNYFSYGTDTEIIYAKDPNNVTENYYIVKDYNSMFKYDITGQDKLKFYFHNANTSLYFQYLDFNKKETQILIQPLVTGLPKSIYLPSKASLYHFLPKEGKSENIYYYLRSKSPETKFVSFRTCLNYPENCIFEGKGDERLISPFIKNIGLWFSQPTNKDQLQLIYVYCDEDCSYDILMTYDEDPLFIFPGNNYTKFIGNNGKDSFILPVLEDLNKNEAIKIDLTVLSGKDYPKLTLYSGRSGTKLNYKPEINERKISYIINKENFISEKYYKKDIYAVVEGNKNLFYNIMYIGASIQNKLLDNNRIIIEPLAVPALGKESDSAKIFSFTNIYSLFYISISTRSCQSKVIINDKETKQGYNLIFEIKTKGVVNVKIYLVNDKDICSEGFEEIVTLFSYSSENTNILIGENNFINSTLNTNELTFTHLFKPSDENNEDNSYNIEIENYSSSILTFFYSIDTIAFDTYDNITNSPFSLERFIKGKKNNIINSKLINDSCGNLQNNQICSLTIKISSKNKPQFTLFLNKNNRKFFRHLTNHTLINSINSKSIQYFYIDLNRKNDYEIVINSYDQDLQMSAKLYSSDSKLEEENYLLSDFYSIPNYYKYIHHNKEDCKVFCKLYIAFKVPEDLYKREKFYTFSINYLIKIPNESQFTYLPINYFSQYSFNDSTLTKINYYFYIYETTNLNVELDSIKKNEDDNSVVKAVVVGNKETSLNSSTKNLFIQDFSGELKISINKPEDDNLGYKLKVSNIGNNKENPINPILSSYSETCKKELCFYTLEIDKENEADYAYFFVPEISDAIISIKKLNYEDDINSYLSKEDEYDISSNNGNKRSNWLEYKITEKNIILLIRLLLPKNNEVNFFASFNSKPNLITLNYGEKRIFTIENRNSDYIAFNIKKPNSSTNNKYKVFLHAVKGNGVIYFKDQTYPIGLDSSYKENISIIVDDDSLANLLMNVTNKKDNDYENIFSFTIEYIINSTEQFLYKIKENTINSFKINRKNKLENIEFYMKANKADQNIYKNISIYIKIFTISSKYDMIAYIVDDNFIENKKKDPNIIANSSVGISHTFVDGGSFTFSKIDISSDEFNPYKNENEDSSLYIYIVFTQKNDNNNKVKIDLYPYEVPYLNDFKWPLSRNEFFIQKLPANTNNYPLLLSKSDLGLTNNIIIDFIFPSSNIYDLAIINYDKNKQIELPSLNESNLIYEDQNKCKNGKYQIVLNPNSNTDLLYILFNIIRKDKNQLKDDDSFIFKYSYDSDKIYREESYFSVEGYTKDVTFTIEATRPKYPTGETILLFNVYKTSDLSKKIPLDYLSIYLLFSDIKPIFTMYKTLYSSSDSSQKYKIKKIDKEGDYYFTCVAVIQDNERIEYIGYKAVSLKLEESDASFWEDLADYIKEHVFASIVIFIIILFVLGVMVNICRTERKKSKNASSKSVELILEDKNIN